MKQEEQEALDDLARLLPTMACDEVQALKDKIKDARSFYETRKVKEIRSMLPILANLKQKGLMFGYPLLADVVSHLEHLIQKSESFSETEFSMMRNDTLLLEKILWKKIKGDGGEQGLKILNQLVKLPK